MKWSGTVFTTKWLFYFFSLCDEAKFIFKSFQECQRQSDIVLIFWKPKPRSRMFHGLVWFLLATPLWTDYGKKMPSWDCVISRQLRSQQEAKQDCWQQNRSRFGRRWMCETENPNDLFSRSWSPPLSLSCYRSHVSHLFFVFVCFKFPSSSAVFAFGFFEQSIFL